MNRDLVDERARESPGRALGAAVATIAVGIMPVALVGTLAPELTADLGFGPDGLGLLVAAFFSASALCSIVSGQVVERFGWPFGMMAVAVLSLCALLGLAVLASSLATALVWAAVGGAANSLCQPSANLGLTRGMSPRRQGTAFGVKQAAVPVATLVAGLAVPAVALTIGWRWAFGLAIVGPLALMGLAASGADRTIRRRDRTATGRHLLSGPLVMLALAGGLGSAAANSFGAFFVDSAVTAGVGTQAAGLALAIGSIAGIAARIGLGWAADRQPARQLSVVGFLMLSGAGVLAAMSVANEPWRVLALSVLMYCTGWGWPGLLSFAVVMGHPRAPAAVSGALMTGVYAGGVLGPLSFGLLAERSGYPTAWLGAAVALLSGAALIETGRHKLATAERTPRPFTPI